MRTVVIPEGVTTIGSHAFYDCRWLTNLTLPEGVANIGDYARAFGWLGYSWMGAAVLMSFTDFSRCSR